MISRSWHDTINQLQNHKNVDKKHDFVLQEAAEAVSVRQRTPSREPIALERMKKRMITRQDSGTEKPKSSNESPKLA